MLAALNGLILAGGAGLGRSPADRAGPRPRRPDPGRPGVTAMTGRPAMRSPGRPRVNAIVSVRRQFWRRIAEGLSSEEAAVGVWCVAAGGRAMVP